MINELNKQNITLKAFNFDQFGTLGPQAESHFYNVKETQTIDNEQVTKNFNTSKKSIPNK